MRRFALLALLLLPASLLGQEADPYLSGPWFTNVAKEVGLEGVQGKDCIFTDLNGDGYHDLCLDRSRLYLSEAGKKFVAHDEHGIEFPVAWQVPMGKDGKPNEAKAKEAPFTPQYLYFADVDNDGDQDALYGVHANWEWYDGEKFVVVPKCDHGMRSSVWLNDGKGKFTRGPESGYTAKDAWAPAMALAIFDYDHDGVLDFYEGAEYRKYGFIFGGQDRLFRGDDKGGFTDVTEAAGLTTVHEPATDRSSRPTYGVTHADVNDDGHQDILQLAYGRQWNYLWLSDGKGRFKDVGRKSGFAGDDIVHGRYPLFMKARGRTDEEPFRSNGNTFDCAVGDVDNDGDLDLFLGEIQHGWAGDASDPSALLLNGSAPGRPEFRRISCAELLPPRGGRNPALHNYGDLHVAFLDVDNDTRLDLLIGSGDYPDGQFLRLYYQREDSTFEEATLLSGFRWEGCGDLSIGDYDRDGDVDVLAGRSFMRLNKKHRDEHMDGIEVPAVALFRNDVANRTGHHWLNVRLVGKTANRSGIGARITVKAGGVSQIREIRCGSGLANHQDPPEACFGLGAAEKIEEVTIRWPDRKLSTQTFKDLPVDRFVVLTQGAKKPEFQ